MGVTAAMIFFRWKAKVLDEYRRWMGYELSPVDQDLLAILRMMHQQGLSPREARFVIQTMEEKGSIEGTRHMAAILAGEQYSAKDTENEISGEQAFNDDEALMSVPTKILEEKQTESNEVRFVVESMGRKTLFKTIRAEGRYHSLYRAFNEDEDIDNPAVDFCKCRSNYLNGTLDYIKEIAQNYVKLIINKDRQNINSPFPPDFFK